MPDYTATGGIRITGCSLPVIVSKYYEFTYGIGSIVYVLAKARKGILEKVVIKKVNLVDFSGTLPIYNYVDTTNRVWLEPELTLQETAQALAISYLERQIGQYRCDQNVVVSSY